MLENVNSENNNIKPLSFEEKQERGILGRLYGPVADCVNSTRNGRLYNEKLWEKVFESPLIKEQFNTTGIFGELGHPADRLETDMEKVAIVMPEPPKKNKNGQLMAYFDILDTPNGRIAYTLAKYGCKLGISSRGNGDVYTDIDGVSKVDEDTYECYAWDLVTLPGVESARLNLVESLGSQNKSLKQVLSEALEKSNEKDRKVQEESLKALNIDYSDSSESSNIETSAASDSGAEVTKTLQESILAKEKAEAKITELQEKLSVSYAKEASLEEQIKKYRDAIRSLSESASSAKGLQSRIKTLTEKLDSKDALIQKEREKNRRLIESQKDELEKRSSLTESISLKDEKIVKANQKIKALTEQLEKSKSDFGKEKELLKEDYESLKKDFLIKQKEYSNKIAVANRLVEHYRESNKKSMDLFLENKSTVLGVNPEEVRNKLPKDYTFEDINEVCEELSDFNLRMSSLPFNVKSVKRATLTESKKIPGTEDITLGGDDDIDESLIRLANRLSQN